MTEAEPITHTPDSMMTGHPTGISTEEYLKRHEALGIPSQVHRNEYHNKHWPCGTRRLVKSDFSKDDYKLFTRFTDLCRFDKDGDYILELCVAYHEEYLDKKFAKQLAQWQRMTAYSPRNPVGRNEPCPCGATKPFYVDGCYLGDGPVKFKNCHGHWSFVPEVTKEQALEQVKALHELSESPDFQAVAKGFADGTISANEMYEKLGVGDGNAQ